MEEANAYVVWFTKEEINALLRNTLSLSREEMEIKLGAVKKMERALETQKQKPE